MNILSILFLTSSNNNSIIPQKNKFILGISTFWILLLFYPSLFISPLISLNIILISIFSPLFWYFYTLNSLFHKLDKFFVWTLFLQIFPISIYNFNPLPNFLFLFSILFSFILSELSIIYNKFHYQLFFHLSFRFFFFSWIFLLFFNYNFFYLSFISFAYIFHNFHLYTILFHFDFFYYIYHIYQLLLLISLFEFLYLKNDYLIIYI